MFGKLLVYQYLYLLSAVTLLPPPPPPSLYLANQSGQL
jgi:hypothetical protein